MGDPHTTLPWVGSSGSACSTTRPSTPTALPNTGNIRDDLIEYARTITASVQSPMRSLWTAYLTIERSHLMADARQRLEDRTMEMLRRGVERGELRADKDPALAAELIFGLIWYRASIDEHMDDALAETLVDAVLDSWSPAPASAAADRAATGSD